MDALLDRLRAERAALATLGGALEAEFVALGRWVRTLSGEAQAIRARCATIVEATRTRAAEEARALGAARTSLERARASVESSVREYASVGQAFASVQGEVATAARLEAALAEPMVGLRACVIQFRIQASWLDRGTEAVVLTLADQISQLVRRVEDLLRRQFGGLRDVRSRTAAIIAGLVEAAARQQRDAEGWTSQNGAPLAALLDEMARLVCVAGQVAGELEASSAALQQDVALVVTGLQFGDVGRQKIEHVLAALDEVGEQLEAARAQGQDSEDGAIGQQVAAEVAIIQLRQLDSLVAEAGEAAGRVRSGVGGLTRDAQAFAASARRLGEACLEPGATARAIQAIDGLLQLVRDPAGKAEGVVRELGGLQVMLDANTAEAAGVRPVLLDVRHAVLNAQLVAAKAENAAAIGPISIWIREASLELLEGCGRLMERLGQISQGTGALRERLDRFLAANRREREEVFGTSTGAAAALAGNEQATPSVAEEIATLHRALACRAEESPLELAAVNGLAAARGGLGEVLQAVIDWAGTERPALLNEAVRARLALLRQSYTMVMERSVHDLAVQRAAAAPAPVGGAPLAGGDGAAGATGDLGENVELF